MAESLEMQTLGTSGLAYAMRASETAHSWRYFHEAYCVNLVLHGRAEFRYRTITDDSVPEYVMLMEPGEIHYNTRVYMPGTFFAVFFEPNRFNALVSAWGWQPGSHFRLCSLADPAVRQAMLGLYYAAIYEDANAQEEHLNLVAGAVMHSATERHLRLPGQSPQAFHRGVRLLRESYDSNPGRTVNIRAIAAECNMGYHSFIHSFRRRTGMAPYQFIKVLRMANARTLLVQGPSDEVATMQDVARACGFSDGPHMTREFKAYQAMPPKMMAARLNPAWLDAPRRMGLSAAREADSAKRAIEPQPTHSQHMGK